MEADYVGFGKAIESDLEWMAKGVGNQVELIESLLDKAAEFGLAEGRDFKEFGQVFVVSGRTKNETECHIVLVAANSTGQAAEFAIRDIMTQAGIVGIEPFAARAQGLVIISTPCPVDSTGVFWAQ